MSNRKFQLCIIKPEYRESYDVTYFISEDKGDRVNISPVNCSMAIRPIECVSVECIEKLEAFVEIEV